MRTQRLTGPRFARPEEVVDWFGASQSQDYGPAKWSLGQRSEGSSDAGIERLFADGTILRTHVLRPTWHFVGPADIRWMLELTGPRVLAQTASYFRRMDLNAATLEKSLRTIERALRGGNHLMRKELKTVLEKSGFDLEGNRIAFIMMNAELRGLICSGPRRGKQHTYGLLEERAPNARTLNQEQALAELTVRFFTSHGPATLKDFGWWSSLKVADMKRGLEMAGSQLTEEEIDGVTYWFSGSPSATQITSPSVALLQAFDEYVVAYKDSRHVIDAAGTARAHDEGFPFTGGVVLDSQMVGTWKGTSTKNEALVRYALYAHPNEAQTRALGAAASDYAHFLGLPPAVEISLVSSNTG
jgi:hypothetical protein